MLAPGGPLLLLWNMEDARLPWVASLRAAYEVHDHAVGARGDECLRVHAHAFIL